MKKIKQIGIRVGVPVFFALELEDVYKRAEGAHRALAFPDFCGLLIGLGLEQYRKGNATEPSAGEDEAPEGIGEQTGGDPLHLFDMNPCGLHDLFREFDEAMEQAEPPERGPRLRLVYAGELA